MVSQSCPTRVWILRGANIWLTIDTHTAGTLCWKQSLLSVRNQWGMAKLLRLLQLRLTWLLYGYVPSLLVLLQNGAIGSTHYFQLFRVFLNFFFFGNAPWRAYLHNFFPKQSKCIKPCLRYILKGWTLKWSFKKHGGRVSSPCSPAGVWRTFELTPPPPSLEGL